MYRWHKDRDRTLREWQKHLADHRRLNVALGESPETIDCLCDFQAGRFRKTKAFGHRHTSHCMCNFEKAFRTHWKEVLSNLDFEEQLSYLEDKHRII